MAQSKSREPRWVRCATDAHGRGYLAIYGVGYHPDGSIDLQNVTSQFVVADDPKTYREQTDKAMDAADLQPVLNWDKVTYPFPIYPEKLGTVGDHPREL